MSAMFWADSEWKGTHWVSLVGLPGDWDYCVDRTRGKYTAYFNYGDEGEYLGKAPSQEAAKDLCRAHARRMAALFEKVAEA